MGAIADLGFIGAPTADPVATARFIAGLVMTRRQKAALLRDYLTEKGMILTDAVKAAADQYVSEL